jgi:nitrogen regulatory protein P-II 1
MKEIKAIIRRIMLDSVIDALHAIEDIPGLTISTVRGYGRRGPVLERLSESEYSKMIKLEIVVPNDMLQTVVQIIASKAHTGNPGDGLIFVSDVEDVIRIREAAGKP